MLSVSSKGAATAQTTTRRFRTVWHYQCNSHEGIKRSVGHWQPADDVKQKSPALTSGSRAPAVRIQGHFRREIGPAALPTNTMETRQHQAGASGPPGDNGAPNGQETQPPSPHID
jgi:hypothetical protein